MKSFMINSSLHNRHVIKLILNSLIILLGSVTMFLCWQLGFSIMELSALKTDPNKNSVEDVVFSDLLNLIPVEYSIDEDENPMDILNEKLTELGIENSIMDISPAESQQSGSFTAAVIKVRLAPLSAENLSLLLNKLEADHPRFYIDTIELTRIVSDSSDMDITLNLIVFQNTRLQNQQE